MNKKLRDAIDEVHNALCCYAEDCITSDKKAQKSIDNAWSVIMQELIVDRQKKD